MTNYSDKPIYLWYTAKRRVEGAYQTYWHKGKQYLAFTSEPDPHTLFIYGLTFVGKGDITLIEKK